LRRKLDVNGSLEYALTWKLWDMRSGPPICALRASARRTEGKGCGGWLTPKCPSGGGQAVRRTPGGGLRKLEDQVLTAGWATPRKADADKNMRTRQGALNEMQRKGANNDLGTTAALAGWATPKAATGDYQYPSGNHSKKVLNLAGQAKLSGWAMPAGRDWKDTPGMALTGKSPDGSIRDRVDQLPRQAHLADVDSGPTSISSPAPMERRGALNPEHSRWLMGFPTEWGNCAPTETPSSRK